jgi:hypothetical protein
VEVYSAGSRWRAEIARIANGDPADELEVLIGDGARVVVLTQLGSTPLSEHRLAQDAVAQAVAGNFDGQGRPRQGATGRTAARSDGAVSMVVVRNAAARADFADGLLGAGEAGRAARGLMRFGVQSLGAGRGEAVVATAAARGATRVRTSRGDIVVEPDLAAIRALDAIRIDIIDLERFIREGRLGAHAAGGAQ